MEIFTKGISAVLGGSGEASQPSGVDTIERLCNRIQSSTLLNDRRDAVRALRSLSKKFRLEVGTQAMDLLVDVLERDRSDVDIVELALDTICNVVSVDSTSTPSTSELGIQFTEIFIKKPKNVTLVLTFVEDYDFHLRWPAAKLLNVLIVNKCNQMQEIIVGSPMGVSKLMDLLSDSRDFIRNEGILILLQLTKGNAMIQKIVAFENAFDRLLDIVFDEGLSDGGIIVEDCILLMHTLLKNNTSNQNFFREASHIHRILPFFDLGLPIKGNSPVQWDSQKIANIMHMLKLVGILVSPGNPQQGVASSQKAIHSCGLTQLFCVLMYSNGLASELLTQAINTVAEVIRGSPANQELFSKFRLPGDQTKSAVLGLLSTIASEKQLLPLRCAALYCFQSFLYKNEEGQGEIVSTLLPSSSDVAQTVSAGQLLCTGLFSQDPLCTWSASVSLAATLNAFQREQLLRVQLAVTADQPPTTLLQLSVDLVRQPNAHLQSRVGLLILLSTWLAGSAQCVTVFLSNQSNMSFLTGLAEHEPDTEPDRLVQGLSCFLLGICLACHPGTELPYSRDALQQIIQQRIGLERFNGCLGFVMHSEAFIRAAKHPQLDAKNGEEILFDHMFTVFFKDQFDTVSKAASNQLTLPSSSHSGRSQSPLAAGAAVVNGAPVEDHDSIVTSYKDLIRDQDQQLRDLKAELESVKAERNEALAAKRDLELRASTISEAKREDDGTESKLQMQLEETLAINAAIQNEIQEGRDAIANLERQLAASRRAEQAASENADLLKSKAGTEEMNLSREIGELKSQLANVGSEKEALIAERDSLQHELNKLQSQTDGQDDSTRELKKVQAEYDELQKKCETIEKEMDDLLVLLTENTEKNKKLKEKLRGLGQEVSDDEDEDDEDEDEDEV
ncbi:general vesicular transport factor p115-like [Oscarella lobularis]|uniref:general vesicular transport factor p115-like n=1 Tax=Oscarella lobularis TaxID=121494 RepID=UPI0033137813